MKNIETKESTALVCIGTGSDAGSAYRRAARPDASFVTHLIATAGMSPQTRKLRQATSAAAINGYKWATSADQPTKSIGIRLSRVA